MSEQWRLDAACRGEDVSLFFPASSLEQAHALRVIEHYCQPCPSQEPCLAFSRATDLPLAMPVIAGGRFRTTRGDWTARELRDRLYWPEVAS